MVAAFESDRASNEFHYLRALEWAERAGEALPAGAVTVSFTVTGPRERRITVTPPNR